MREDTVTEHEDMGRHKGNENRRQNAHRFFYAPDVQNDEGHNQHYFKGQLEVMISNGQKAEKRVAAGSDGNSYGKDVIDQQGAAGNNSGFFSQRVRRNNISPPP